METEINMEMDSKIINVCLHEEEEGQQYVGLQDEEEQHEALHDKQEEQHQGLWDEEEQHHAGLSDEEEQQHEEGLPDASSAPWLIFHNHREEGHKFQTIFSIKERGVYMRSIPELREHAWILTSHGWFLLTEPISTRSFLWNPVCTTKIKMPEGLTLSTYSQCLMSSSPSDLNCVISCIDYKEQCILSCRPNLEKKWARHKHDVGDSNKDRLKDVVLFRGKFYGVTRGRDLAKFDFDDQTQQLKITVMAIDGPPALLHNPNKKHLVVCCEELFLVDSYISPVQDKTSDILLFKLDLSKRKWEQVDGIGDRAFFLQNNSMSFSASELGLDKGSIFFIEKHDNCPYVYNTKDGTICRSLYRPQSQWTHSFFLRPPPSEL